MRRRPSRIEILVLVGTLVRVFLLISIHVRDPPYPLHRPPSIDLSRSPVSAAVLRPGPLQVLMRDILARARRPQTRSACGHGVWRWLSPLGGRTKMAEMVASPLSGGDGVADDGGKGEMVLG